MPGTSVVRAISSSFARISSPSAGSSKRRSIQALACSGTMFRFVPPAIVPTFNRMPRSKSVSDSIASTFRASATIALWPSVAALETCAATPSTASRN
ncbi:MAG TPA: hypothetical protein VKF60_09520 [Myxococcota bacterium]|nr:hypothetical protein [Myxococcota bacterium]